jgi:hypothetical protein
MRRSTEAAIAFAPNTSVQTRTYAPGPVAPLRNIGSLFTPVTVAPNSTRLAYDNASTSAQLPPTAAASVQPACSVTFAILPCQVLDL